jgi:hypothetical protein
MRSKTEIKQYAKGLAEGLFYCDDECKIPYELFEHWEPAEVKQECKMLAQSVVNAMLWAQGREP